MAKINGQEFPVKKVFSNDFDFEIPGYQRPYAWTTEEAGQLFEDLYDFMNQTNGNDEEPYFLGSIVLIKEEGKPKSYVIDGQQRLTTLTILLSTIANRLKDDNRKAFMGYIMAPGNPVEDLEPKPRLALRERDREFFQRYIQTEDGLESMLGLNRQELSDPQRNIVDNAELFMKRLDELDDGIVFEFGKFIVNRCYMVVVATATLNSAYRIFAVLNDRGLDLLASDILKAEIIGAIPTAKQKEYTNKWEEVEEYLGRDALTVLLAHIRMIYRRAKQQRTLVEEFRQYVLKSIGSEQIFIDNVLIPFGKIYHMIISASYESASDPQAINTLIKWLLQIDNTDWVPPTLLYFHKHLHQEGQLREFLMALERLAASMFIRRCYVNERIERYARVIKAIDQDEDLAAADSPLQLTDSEKTETLEMLSGDVYLNTKTRRYILLRLDSWLADRGASYDHSILTVEHVLPQSVDSSSDWLVNWPNEDVRKAWVHKISNLVLLSRSRNSSAQNYSFAEKKEKYFRSKSGVSTFALTTDVLNEVEWTPEVVERRQQRLLGVLRTGWNL